MVKKIRICNFKCYGPRGADFNLAKINFIYGDNSVGKSSFLQFLTMLVSDVDHQARYSRENFDRFVFRGGVKQDGMSAPVTARIRFVGEDEKGRKEAELKFVPAQGVQDSGLYRLESAREERIDESFWDLYLPKGGGECRINHKPAPREGDSVASESPAAVSRTGGLAGESFMNVVALETDQDAVDYVNDIFRRLGVHYSCVREAGGAVSSTRIHDEDFGIDLDVNDVGTGIAGIMRLALRLKDWKGGILALEEPETNINENQLAALTRVLVEEALARPKGQLIVECHSKLMVLQLSALVRSGLLRVGTDEEISIMEIEKHAEGSVVRQVKVNERGDLSWPTDFFPAESEILRSTLGIAQ